MRPARRVVQVSEVLPVDNEYRYRLSDVFVMELPEGSKRVDDGVLVWTGARPAMAGEVQARLLVQSLPSLSRLFADKKPEEG